MGRSTAQGQTEARKEQPFDHDAEGLLVISPCELNAKQQGISQAVDEQDIEFREELANV